MNELQTEIDQEVISAALKGNGASYTIVVGVYKKRLGSVLRGHGVSLNDIDDILQHTFMRLWEKREITQGTNIFGWLCTTALNRAKETYRKTNRMQLIGDDALFDSMMPPVEDILPDEHQVPDLHTAIAKLDDPYKSILIMQLSGLSYKKMAEHLDCPIGTIMSNRSKAVSMLRKKYKKIAA